MAWVVALGVRYLPLGRPGDVSPAVVTGVVMQEEMVVATRSLNPGGLQ